MSLNKGLEVTQHLRAVDDEVVYQLMIYMFASERYVLLNNRESCWNLKSLWITVVIKMAQRSKIIQIISDKNYCSLSIFYFSSSFNLYLFYRGISRYYFSSSSLSMSRVWKKSFTVKSSVVGRTELCENCGRHEWDLFVKSK